MCECLNINVAAPRDTYYRAIGLRVAATGLITADSDGDLGGAEGKGGLLDDKTGFDFGDFLTRNQ